jgi:hypothetical protein
MTYRYNERLHHHFWDLTPIGLVWGFVTGLIIALTITSILMIAYSLALLSEIAK